MRSISLCILVFLLMITTRSTAQYSFMGKYECRKRFSSDTAGIYYNFYLDTFSVNVYTVVEGKAVRKPFPGKWEKIGPDEIVLHYYNGTTELIHFEDLTYKSETETTVRKCFGIGEVLFVRN